MENPRRIRWDPLAQSFLCMLSPYLSAGLAHHTGWSSAHYQHIQGIQQQIHSKRGDITLSSRTIRYVSWRCQILCMYQSISSGRRDYHLHNVSIATNSSFIKNVTFIRERASFVAGPQQEKGSTITSPIQHYMHARYLWSTINLFISGKCTTSFWNFTPYKLSRFAIF